MPQQVPAMDFVTTTLSSSANSHESQQRQLIFKLGVFKIQGRDKSGRPILQIIGKLFPGRLVSAAALKKFLVDEIFPRLAGGPFSIVYVHTGVNAGQNFPGVLGLKSVFEAIPNDVMQNLSAVYFLHPTLHCRFFLAIFGRLLFSGTGAGVYWKLRYVDRLEFLRKYVRWDELGLPEFVHHSEEETDEVRSAVDLGPESDHPRFTIQYPNHQWTALSTYSLRCIT